MSVHVLSWVLRHSPVENHAQRLTLLVLADHASGDGTGAYPSNGTIMREGKIKSKTTVRECLRELEAHGHIEYEGISPLQTKSWRVITDGAPPPATAQERASWPDAPGASVTRTGESANDPPSRDDPEPSLKPPFEQPDLAGASQDGSRSAFDPPPPTAAQDATWQQARAELRDRAADHKWHIWLEPIELDHVEGTSQHPHYVLTAPPHIATSVAQRYHAMITAALRHSDQAATIEIRTRTKDAPQGSRAASPRERAGTVSHEEEAPCTTPSPR